MIIIKTPTVQLSLIIRQSWWEEVLGNGAFSAFYHAWDLGWQKNECFWLDPFLCLVHGSRFSSDSGDPLKKNVLWNAEAFWAFYRVFGLGEKNSVFVFEYKSSGKRFMVTWIWWKIFNIFITSLVRGGATVDWSLCRNDWWWHWVWGGNWNGDPYWVKYETALGLEALWGHLKISPGDPLRLGGAFWVCIHL